MNPEYTKLALDLRAMIGRARTISDTTDFNEVFTSAENIIGTLSYLITPLVELERAYRVKVVEYMNADDSAAKAEAKAKASDEYASWKKLQMLYDLGSEQILLLKKFQTKLETGYGSS